MLTGEDAAHMPTGADAKWRFFWRYASQLGNLSGGGFAQFHGRSLGEQPTKTDFPELNAPPVIPRAFPNWGKVMDEYVTVH